MITLKLDKYNREQAEKLYDILYTGYKKELIDRVCPNILDCKYCEYKRVCKDLRNAFGYIDGYADTES